MDEVGERETEMHIQAQTGTDAGGPDDTRAAARGEVGVTSPGAQPEGDSGKRRDRRTTDDMVGSDTERCSPRPVQG